MLDDQIVAQRPPMWRWSRVPGVDLRNGAAVQRVGVPDDIGPMIANLLNANNRWINAQRIEVSGGQGL